jgi:hypothetical protein
LDSLVTIQGRNRAPEDTSTHAAAAEAMRDAGCIVITRHRGGGCVDPSYLLSFRNFNSFVAQVRLAEGCFYWEVEILDIVPAVQFGVCAEWFEAREDPDGEGAGDDAFSWAVCGFRQERWHKGEGLEFGSTWIVGDVIGFALDMRSAGAAVMSVSVNGSFAAPNGPLFKDIDAPFLSPVLSAYGGQHRLNLGDRPFVHEPPHDGAYMSAHTFHRSNES